MCMIVLHTGFGQLVPGGSMYLGQSVPGTEPKVFPLEVTPGSFAAERVSINKDGTEIYYSEVKGYYPVTGDKTRWYRYEKNAWSRSSVLFDGFFSPALSLTGDTLFVEHDFKMFYAVRTAGGWSTPRRFFCSIDTLHYVQVSSRGNYYASARSRTSVGLADWSRIQVIGKDTSAVSLGFPLNNVGDNLDFAVAMNEQYMITCAGGPIGISYPLHDGRWSNMRYFDPKINFGLGGWGVSLSPDGRYLFYTSGTKPDYSDTHVYWVALGNRIDSMQYTNLPPYVKNKPSSLTVQAGNAFVYTLPADAIFDDDGKVITYEALLLDGSPLPAWLFFDPVTKTLSGTSKEPGTVTLRINAYDEHKAMAAFRFTITITGK
jgi:hypothetical protein